MPTLYRIRSRRDTAANWTSANPTLGLGEQGVETDTRLEKVGDGATSWTALPYAADGAPTISGTRAAPVDVTAVGGITPPTGFNKLMYVQGSGGPVTVTANPQVVAGTIDGQLLELRGRSNTKVLTLSNGNGLSLNGACPLAADDSLWLRWDTVNWVEIARRENA